MVDLSDDEDSSSGAGKPAPAARPPPQPQQPVTTVAYTYGPPPASVAAANGQRIILAPGTGLATNSIFYCFLSTTAIPSDSTHKENYIISPHNKPDST